MQVFEVTIRLLGGLLSAYQMSGEPKFLTLAEDLGNRLLPAFNSPTGMPYRFVNLRTGKTTGEVSNPAEIGTLMLEFGALGKLTHRDVFYDKAKHAIGEVYRRRDGPRGSSVKRSTSRPAPGPAATATLAGASTRTTSTY